MPNWDESYPPWQSKWDFATKKIAEGKSGQWVDRKLGFRRGSTTKEFRKRDLAALRAEHRVEPLVLRDKRKRAASEQPQV
jgi:hypothetical protein